MCPRSVGGEVCVCPRCVGGEVCVCPRCVGVGSEGVCVPGVWGVRCSIRIKAFNVITMT